MPLNKTGKDIKKNFEKEYGKKKGDNIFYAWENKKKHNAFILKKSKGGKNK